MRISSRLYLSFLLIILASSLFSQETIKGTFNFGVKAGMNFSQIEGDNLRGFNHSGYEFGLLGGYNLSNSQEIVVTSTVRKIGSDRKGESSPRFTNKVLVETDLNMVSLGVAYSKKFSQDWDGNYHFRYFGGFNYNFIFDQKTSVITGTIGEVIDFENDDFRSTYLNLNFGVGLIVNNDMIFDLSYHHGLQSVIFAKEEIKLSKLVPFHLELSVSYYL